MPHDASLIEETRAWFRRATSDVRTATFELSGGPELNADIAFHAQQAAEKAMKGFLTWHQRSFRKTHSLVELG